MNDEFAEVIDGVEEGEEVILAPESAIVDGTSVQGTKRE
jgi:antitoxin (DNA-binding transcriptional repressor) of toxin-antitoxin stability system